MVASENGLLNCFFSFSPEVRDFSILNDLNDLNDVKFARYFIMFTIQTTQLTYLSNKEFLNKIEGVI